MSNLASLTPISTANAPDVDWTQVRETVRMLNLAVAQIAVSMREGDDSVEALSSSFTSMADTVQVITRLTDELDDEGEQGEVKVAVANNCQAMSAKVHTAIVAFQFYDRLVQRLTHVRESLNALGVLVDDPSRLHSPDEWRRLQEQIRARYTMESEREMFDFLMGGASVEESLELWRKEDEQAAEHDVEFF